MTYAIMLLRNQEIAVHSLHSDQIAGRDTRNGPNKTSLSGNFWSADPYMRVIVHGEALANRHAESVVIVVQKSNLKIILIVPLVISAEKGLLDPLYFFLNPYPVFFGTITERDFWKKNPKSSLVTSQLGPRK